MLQRLFWVETTEDDNAYCFLNATTSVSSFKD